MPKQLAFNLRLRDGSSFENFHGGENREALDCLRRLLADPRREPASLYLWGERASGKTHLLEAACRWAQAQGAAAFYLPLAAPEMRPAVLEAAEHFFVICLDDVQHVAGNTAWEAALFASYELARATGARMVAAASAPPGAAGFKMPELITRFGWGPVYQLRVLNDSDKLDAIRLRARNRGIDVPRDVARYILHRYPRDLASIFALLERIDTAALASRRRITIPFLRQLDATGDEE